MGEKFVGAVQKLDLPFQPSPSGTGLTVIAREENRNAYAVSVGYTPSLASQDRVECAALITIRGVVQSIHGYPNEEAFWKDPRGKLGHGVYEILGSAWIAELNTYNRASFGTAFITGDEIRHFFIGGKDSSAQFLAKSLSLDLFTQAPRLSSYEAALGEALHRLDQYPEP